MSLADAGFGHLVCGWPSEGRSRIEAFAGTVMVDCPAKLRAARASL